MSKDTSKIDKSESAPRTIPEFDFGDNLKGIAQIKVCRTCSHQSQRTWKVSTDEIIEHSKTGGSVQDLRCHPDVNDVPVEIRSGPPRRNVTKGDRTVARFNTCGQSILPKCRNCARFEPVRVQIPFVRSGSIYFAKDTTSTGEIVFVPKGKRVVNIPGEGAHSEETKVQFWNATVGGHCRIPAEGMMKNGRKVTCDPQPKKLRIESASCANCQFVDWAGEDMQFEGTVNENARLSQYERWEIIQNTDPADVGKALGMALWRKQTSPIGRITWHRARIMETIISGGKKHFILQFTEGEFKKVRVRDGDDRLEVYPDSTGKLAAVMVRYPAHKILGLNLPLHSRHRIWPKLPAKLLTLPSRPPVLADPDCPRCKPERSSMRRIEGRLRITVEHAIPCYYHAKAPKDHVMSGDIVFHHNCSISAREQLRPEATLKVIKDGDDWRVVDGNNKVPEPYGTDVANASVFRLWLSSLRDIARIKGGDDAVQQVNRQYAELVSRLRVSNKTSPIRPTWLKYSGVERSKPFCSHPDGIDFRKAWQDAFGSERVERRFDEGDFNSTQVEEEIRSGMRGHNLTPQRLQEEMVATEQSHRWYNPRKHAIEVPEELKAPEPETWTRVQIRGIAGMTDEDGNPIEDVDAFLDRLDEHVAVGHAEAAYGVDDTRYLTRRQQLFGYTITRGRFGKRKGYDATAMSSLDPDFVIFDYNPEEDDHFIHDIWYCPNCSAPHDNVDDLTDPHCERCDSPLYRNHRSTGTFNPRVAGGIGGAIAPDSAQMQQQRRLWAQVCPNWVLRGSSPPITLERLEGDDPDEPVLKSWRSRHKKRSNQFFDVDSLTTEMREANQKYMVAFKAIEEAREAYKKQNEGISSQELEERFPPPDLPFYKERGQGSLSKMGGTASSE